MASAGDEQPSKVSFDDYSWEQDEEWQVLIKKLEFPASFDESKKKRHILKRKQKYFKAKVDPDFQPTIGSKPKPAPATTPPPEPESNPHDPDTNNTSSTSSSAQSAPQQDYDQKTSSEPTASASSSSSSSSSSYNRGGYGSGGRGGYQSYQPPPTKIGQMLSPLLNLYYLCSQWFVFVSCLLSLASKVFYYRALYATVLMYAINAIQSNGRPQMNMYYASRLMQDSNVFIAIYAAIFLMGNPVFLFLSPLLLRSLWMGVFMLNGLLRAKVPSVHQKVGHYLKPILQRMGWFNERIALMEVFVGIFLIFAMFFMSRTVILCFVYWQIMHARYMMDYQIQCAFRTVHSKIQSLLSRVPFLLNLYLKMTGYLWNMVDPQRLQQQMQSGGAGSGLGGLMSKCNIM